MGENGVIGNSGTFYECDIGNHIQTCIDNNHDTPFVLCQRGDWLAAFSVPNRAQYETAMEWCTNLGIVFEDAAICPEWDKWLQD